MDAVDRAQEREDIHRQAALNHVKQQQQSAKPSREYCLECDDLIPAERRRAIPGVELCTECQSMQEQRSVR